MAMPRMESRMQGNLHVRFGAGDEETCLGNGARRFIPTLPENPVCTLTLGALRGVPAEGGVPATSAPARGKAFPLKTLSGLTQLRLLIFGAVERY